MHSDSTTLPEDTKKRCTLCGETKPRDAFFRRDASGALRAHCKRCHFTRRPRERRTYSHWETVTTRLRMRAKGFPHAGKTPSREAVRLTLGTPETCYLCGESLLWEEAEIDHVLPLSQGGTNDVTNLRWAHRTCNRIKGDLTLAELRRAIGKLRKHMGAPEDELATLRKAG